MFKQELKELEKNIQEMEQKGTVAKIAVMANNYALFVDNWSHTKRFDASFKFVEFLEKKVGVRFGTFIFMETKSFSKLIAAE